MNPKKRGPNEGSIYKVKNRDLWAAQVTVNGKRLTKYAKTRRAAQDWIRATLNQVEAGLTIEGARAHLSDYLAQWLRMSRPSLRPKTWGQYEQISGRYIVPTLGKIRLKDLRPDHIQSLYSDLLGAEVGTRTVQIVHSVLHKSLSQAVQWGLIGRNPAAYAKKPKTARREMITLSVDQARALLGAARESRYYALFHLAIYTGLRQGELLGLKWGDLDRDNRTLQIQRQVQRGPEGLVLAEPKTASARRSISLSQGDLEILRAHRAQQLQERLFAGAKWVDNDLIFPSSLGTPTDPRNIIREFKRVLKSTDIGDIRFHDLRHTAASLMLSAGVHPKVVQERLGHSDIKTTLNTYSHVIPSLHKEAAEKMAELLS